MIFKLHVLVMGKKSGAFPPAIACVGITSSLILLTFHCEHRLSRECPATITITLHRLSIGRISAETITAGDISPIKLVSSV